MKGHALSSLVVSLSTAAATMLLLPAPAKAGPDTHAGVPYSNRTDAVIESQAGFNFQRNGNRAYITPKLHARQYASHRHNVKFIWYNDTKSPTDITATDLANGGKAFDGFIIQRLVGTKDDPKRNDQFAWCAFTDRHYTLDGSDDDIGKYLTALENLPPDPMPERFIRVVADPYHVPGFNWSDDGFWNNVASNMKVASKMCHDANLRGIFLDTEGYNGLSYSYKGLKNDPKYAGMSYEDMSAIAENRGRQVMRALNSEDPSITIYVTFSSIAVSQHMNRAALTNNGSLLIPFLDGMLDGSTGSTTFIDGAEYGYFHDDRPSFFSDWRKVTLDASQYNVRFQKYPDKFLRQYEVGFALYLDRTRDVNGKWGVFGWCNGAMPQLFYSPARLAYTVQQAVKASDEYMWFYAQKVDAWAAPGSTPTALPRAFADAMRDGQRHGNDPSLPPLPQNNSPGNAADLCGK
jgi:hypothetical protein